MLTDTTPDFYVSSILRLNDSNMRRKYRTFPGKSADMLRFVMQ